MEYLERDFWENPKMSSGIFADIGIGVISIGNPKIMEYLEGDFWKKDNSRELLQILGLGLFMGEILKLWNIWRVPKKVHLGHFPEFLCPLSMRARELLQVPVPEHSRGAAFQRNVECEFWGLS